MSHQWESDKRWSDRFLPETKRILGEYLIGEPPVVDDMERNTDLTVLKMEAVRIGCRTRKSHYFEAYGDEFTIRSGRPSGVKTELTKIIEGWGDYFFYGFSNSSETALQAWTLGDLKVFRLWYSTQLYLNKNPPGFLKINGDGSSSFLAFKWADLPDEFVVARIHRPNED